MFSVRTTRGAVSIILTDVIICAVSFGITIGFLTDSVLLSFYGPFFSYATLALLSCIVVSSSAIGRLYSLMEYLHPVDLAKRITPTFLLSVALTSIFAFLAENLLVFRWQMIPALVLIYAILFFFRYFIFFILSKNRQRVLFLGYSGLARGIIEDDLAKRFKGYEIIGLLATAEYRPGEEFYGIPVLGTVSQLEQVTRDHPVDTIVVALRDRRGKLPMEDLLRCRVRNVRVQECWSFYERIRRKLPIDDFLTPSWFVFENGFYQSSLNASVKRWQGVVVSAIALLVFLPIILLLIILIKLDSPGPVFYRQKRVGMNGKVFHLLKFRSMVHDAEKTTGPVYAQEDDPRITRVGRVMRKLRLDEIPQLFNVLKGDMDMVGPRPERPFFVKQLGDQIPYYNLRHTVRPGVTGWAQVNYTYGDSVESAKQKLQYDLYYVKHMSWYLDLVIVFLTIKEVLWGGGR